MATVSLVENGVVGDLKYSIVDYTGPASYTTGGEALTAQELGLPPSATIFTIQVMPSDATVADFRAPVYIPATQKVMLLVTVATGANVEAVNASNQSAVSLRLLVLGR
jgi:hypothetical protein